ncbi:helix-turn-helix transcriptional regulator [Sphingopyxis sp.]|jgi:DNA-binding CsgD family transcriptional regulator|uniref:response regulator transcription factor n=1 Tax=Sphingopyxis sp. TaxID=1908224 RepID=UPI002DF15105|nr:helix-turn-helix transcriptional regulator [Sphingopyxis sp.]
MTDEASPDETDRRIARLSPVERRCLELVAKGLTSKDIAREMVLSPNTVDTYLKSATKKLRVSKRSLAAHMVIKAPTAATPKLVSQNWGVPNGTNLADKEVSAGQGDGPADLVHRSSRKSASHDSGRDTAWPERNNPIAKFFGDENRLSTGQRLTWIVGLSIGAAIAMGILINALAAISRALSSP